MFKKGETYYLLQCGWPCPMIFIEETDTEYIFMDNLSPWGGSKEEIIELVEKGQLTQDKNKIQQQVEFIKSFR